MGQQLLNGIFLGSIYALFAVGYTLVFGVLDILNLAHQAVFMLAAFVAKCSMLLGRQGDAKGRTALSLHSRHTNPLATT